VKFSTRSRAKTRCFFFLYLRVARSSAHAYLSTGTENRRRVHFRMMKRIVDGLSRKPAIAKLWLIDSSSPSLDFFAV